MPCASVCVCVRVDVCSVSLTESGGCLLRGLGSPTLVPASRQIGLLWVLHPSGTLSILSHCRRRPKPHGRPKTDCSVARVSYAVLIRYVPVCTPTTLALRAPLAPGVRQIDQREVQGDLPALRPVLLQTYHPLTGGEGIRLLSPGDGILGGI